MRRMIAAWTIPLVLPLLVVSLAPPAHAFCEDKWIGYCSEGGHNEITDSALDFLSQGIRSAIRQANTDQDSEAGNLPERHFTNCLFTKSTDYIRSQYDEVVAAIGPSGPDESVDSQTATLRWGQLLHPVQDFYSHSAWVDPVPVGLDFGTTHARRLLDSRLTNWRRLEAYQKLFPTDSANDDIVVVQGDYWPRGVVDLPRNYSGNPTSAVPFIEPFWTTSPSGTLALDLPSHDYKLRYRGLMTASAAPFANGNGQCPPAGVIETGADGNDATCLSRESVCIRHGDRARCSLLWGVNGYPIYDNCMQHDYDSRRDWRAAFDSAIAQTEHEWCRLLNLTRDQGGFPASSIPMALWVSRDDRPYSTPHPLGTACAPERKGPIHLRLNIEAEVLGSASNPSLSFVAYTDDFRQSVRKLSRWSTEMSGTLDICLNPTDTLVTTLQGWEDSAWVGYGGRFDPYEPVLAGLTRAWSGSALASAEGAAPLFLDSSNADLRLRLLVSPDASLEDCNG